MPPTVTAFHGRYLKLLKFRVANHMARQHRLGFECFASTGLNTPERIFPTCRALPGVAVKPRPSGRGYKAAGLWLGLEPLLFVRLSCRLIKSEGSVHFWSQGVQVPHGADGAGGARARAHSIRGSLHLQLGARVLSEYYRQHGKGKPWAELSAELTRLKQTALWLYDFDAQMLQQALADLRRAYSNFCERRGKFPKFKKKRAARHSFRIPQRVRIENGCVSIPSIGRVRIRQSQAIELATKSATIKRTAAGHFPETPAMLSQSR